MVRKDHSQQFRRISWLWNYLSAVRRSGQMHCIDDARLCRPAGSLVLPCLACPLPGFNTNKELNKQCAAPIYLIVFCYYLHSQLQASQDNGNGCKLSSRGTGEAQ